MASDLMSDLPHTCTHTRTLSAAMSWQSIVATMQIKGNGNDGDRPRLYSRTAAAKENREISIVLAGVQTYACMLVCVCVCVRVFINNQGAQRERRATSFALSSRARLLCFTIVCANTGRCEKSALSGATAAAAA